jgi:hypothetical protein
MNLDRSRTKRRRRLSQQDLRALGVQGGLVAVRYTADPVDDPRGGY